MTTEITPNGFEDNPEVQAHLHRLHELTHLMYKMSDDTMPHPHTGEQVHYITSGCSEEEWNKYQDESSDIYEAIQVLTDYQYFKPVEQDDE